MRLVNDFVANGYGLLTLQPDEVEILQDAPVKGVEMFISSLLSMILIGFQLAVPLPWLVLARGLASVSSHLRQLNPTDTLPSRLKVATLSLLPALTWRSR